MKALFFFLVVSLHVAFGLESKTIVDMYGRTVNIPSTVHSVVTAGGTPAVNSFLFALGAQDAITNGLPGAIEGKNWKMQTLFAPKLSSLPTVSNGGPEWNINVEALHTIAHDVVFVVNQNSAEFLAQKGFCVVALQWSTPYSVKETMTLLSEILGLQNRAAAYNDYYDRTLRFVAQKVAHVSSRPKALYLRYTNFSLPMVSTATWMIEHAGGINVAANVKDHATISIEQLLTWNPDFLFVWNTQEKEAIYRDKRLVGLNAIQNQKVFAMPMGSHVWTHYTPEQPLAVLWAAEKFFPLAFQDVSIPQEIVSFYTTFFGVTLDEEHVGKILNP